MSLWFVLTLIFATVAALSAVFVKVEARKNNERLEVGENLSADDFEIIESD